MSTTIFVYTMSRQGEVGAWSRYLFPGHVDKFCKFGDDLYIRAGDDVLKVDETASMDYAGDSRNKVFNGIVQWPWLDFGQPGVSKQLIGMDFVSTSTNVQVDLGYDESNQNSFTPAYQTGFGDTVPGTFIPFPILVPSFSIRLTFSSLDFWELQAVNVYLQDQRPTA